MYSPHSYTLPIISNGLSVAYMYIYVLWWETDVPTDFSVCVTEHRQIICEAQGRSGLITAAGPDLICGCCRIRQRLGQNERQRRREGRETGVSWLESWSEDKDRRTDKRKS